MNKNTRDSVKAYQNSDFLNSSDARELRILAEYLEPESRFARYQVDDTIVFFGSARLVSREQAEEELKNAKNGDGDVEQAKVRLEMSTYYEAAREMAHRLTEWSKQLVDDDRRFVVCTGGGPGIMEAANRGASEAKGLNVGLTISLPTEETGNSYITRELCFNFHYFFMRKFWFAYLAKAVIVFPGGFGRCRQPGRQDVRNCGPLYIPQGPNCTSTPPGVRASLWLARHHQARPGRSM